MNWRPSLLNVFAYMLIVGLSFILQHRDAYQVILDGVKGGPKEKRLAAQFIPKFFSNFPELADAAINAQLDLCEDEDVSVSIKGTYSKCSMSRNRPLGHRRCLLPHFHCWSFCVSVLM